MISLKMLRKEQTEERGIRCRERCAGLYQELCSTINEIAKKLVAEISSDVDCECLKYSYMHKICDNQDNTDILLLIKSYAKEKITDALTSAGYTDFRVKFHRCSREYRAHIGYEGKVGNKKVVVSTYKVEVVI